MTCNKFIRNATALLKYQEMVKIRAKNWFLGFFCEFFCLIPVTHYELCPMSYAMQDFAKWLTWLRYISVVTFIRVAFVVVKLKTKVFHTNSPFTKWPLFGVFLDSCSPKYCSILLNFWPKVFSNKTNTLFVKFFKILNPSSNSFGSFGGPIYFWKTKNIAKNQHFCKYCILRNIK